MGLPDPISLHNSTNMHRKKKTKDPKKKGRGGKKPNKQTNQKKTPKNLEIQMIKKETP